MHTYNRFLGYGIAAVLVAASMGLTAHAARTNNVPVQWNVTPIQNGAYLEGFEAATLPDWATGTLVTNTPAGPFPSRSNAWFNTTHDKVLQLNGDVAVTNAFTNTLGAVSFATNAVFVDMRIKFDALDTLSTDQLAHTKFALFANSASNLVAAVNGTTWVTNSVPLNLTNWYQVTVKLAAGKFDVLTNDVTAFSGLNLDNSEAANVLSSMAISGTAMLDELYVSQGNPAYVGALGGVPPTTLSFPGTGGSDVTNWLANFFNDGRLSSSANFTLLTSADLDAAYLLNLPLGGSSTSPTAPVFAFGIEAINLTSPTSVAVACRLTTNSVAKSGTITGRVQLLQKQNWSLAESWSTNGTPVTPNFVNGSATCPFTIPSGYRFFHAQIVP
jgi:hypothetical protein